MAKKATRIHSLPNINGAKAMNKMPLFWQNDRAARLARRMFRRNDSEGFGLLVASLMEERERALKVEVNALESRLRQLEESQRATAPRQKPKRVA